MWVATQAPHEHRAFCARLLGIPEHRVRAIARDTGGGFGQKIFVQRDEMCVMLAATKLPAPVKWIEDRRENLMAAGWSRHEHADVRMAFDDDGLIQAVHIDFVSDAGAYPTPWPAMPAMSVGSLFPGPYRVPAAGFRLRSVYTNTAGRSGYRGPWQYETLAREVMLDIAARQMGIDPVELRRRNLLRIEDMPYKNPNGMTFDYISPLETFERAVDLLDYDGLPRRAGASPREAATSVSASRTTSSRRRPAFGIFATEGATIRIEPIGTVNVYVAGGSLGQQPRDGGRAAHRRRARRRHRGRQHHPGRHRAHRLRRRHRRQPQRGDARRCHRRDRRRSACPDRGHRRAPPRGRGRRHRGRARVGERPRHADEADLASPRSRRSRTSDRRRSRRRAARPRGERPLQGRGPFELGERDPHLHVRGRRRDRGGHAAALHRRRGLRADDQPERRRGPDRRRHGAGHRRRAARAHRLRRRRQPAGDHVHGLPAADRHRRARHRVRPRRDAGPDARRLQGRRRRRRHRCAACRRQRRQRRPLAARRHPHPAAADAGEHPRAPRRRSQ